MLLHLVWQAARRSLGSRKSDFGQADSASGCFPLTPALSLRACLKNGWHGRPACAGRRPADRNERGCAEQKADLIGWRCPSRSVRRVAGRHRPVACATQNRILRHALREREAAGTAVDFFRSRPLYGCDPLRPKRPHLSPSPRGRGWGGGGERPTLAIVANPAARLPPHPGLLPQGGEGV